MAMNRIQFQPGLSLAAFLRDYGEESQCEAALVKARWPQGYVCGRCQCTRFSPTHNGRRLWQCKDCGYQSSAIVGTVMEHTKLPLTTWFLAMYFLSQSKNGISALALKRHLGVSYPTAWLLRHKLMQVMYEREQATVLSGRIEIDDAFLGGERPGRQGRGGNKVPFLAAVETDLHGRPRVVRFDRVADHSRAAIGQWASAAIDSASLALSDGWPGFASLSDWVQCHEPHVTGHGPKAAKHPEFHWVNTLLSNLKTALSGTFHAFDFKTYGHRYLAEFAWRFNRRSNLPAMLPRLIHAAVSTKPWPQRKLRLSEPPC